LLQFQHPRAVDEWVLEFLLQRSVYLGGEVQPLPHLFILLLIRLIYLRDKVSSSPNGFYLEDQLVIYHWVLKGEFRLFFGITHISFDTF